MILSLLPAKFSFASEDAFFEMIEAEDMINKTGALGGFIAVSDAAASGGKAMQAKNVAGTTEPPVMPLRYEELYVEKAGSYKLFILYCLLKRGSGKVKLIGGAFVCFDYKAVSFTDIFRKS